MATVVAFHAHPDDEVLLTGGTLARAVAEGHRVVVVVATDVMGAVSDPPDRQRFVRADTDEAAGRLATLLREENTDVLLSYDPNGGYGHRDHVKVHEVGKRAAELAGVERVLEATLPRDFVERMVRAIRALRIPFGNDPEELARRYSPASAITHRIDVRGFARQKQAALAAHSSQVNGSGRLSAVMRLLVRMPAPVFGPLLGREWFVETR